MKSVQKRKVIVAAVTALLVSLCIPLFGIPTVSASEMTHIDVSQAKRSDTTTVGAIRWDAWYGHDGVPGSVISQVEDTLSPAKYHFRAPFFAKVTEEGRIEIPEYTQEIFDREMEYAMEAGLDYFAYVWYNYDGLRNAREFHVQSRYRNEVKICACLDDNAIGNPQAQADLEALFREDCYMTVLDGRPLMFYFGTGSNADAIARDIEQYRHITESLGIPAPYAVVMGYDTDTVRDLYGDAVSTYAQFGTNDMTFAQLAESAQRTWKKWRRSGVQLVPNVTFGWHPAPRLETPCDWTGAYPTNSWVDYATDQELINHLSYALSYANHPETASAMMANTVIIYGWNEHDEGGWICPTIEVDADGNQLFHEDGSPKINDSHLKAVKTAIEKYHNGELPELTINGVSHVAQAPKETTEEMVGAVTDEVTDKRENPAKPGKGCASLLGGGTVGLVSVAISAVLLAKRKET